MLFSNEAFFSEIARMLAEGQSVTIRAKGRSMLPFIVDGRDRVVLQKKESVQVGDIVLANVPERGYVLHRVYRKTGDRLVLMGDGNLKMREQCSCEAVVGTVISIIRQENPVDSASSREQAKARLWRWLLPVRRYLLFIYRHCSNRF